MIFIQTDLAEDRYRIIESIITIALYGVKDVKYQLLHQAMGDVGSFASDNFIANPFSELTRGTLLLPGKN
jgi:hypothetical protein